MIFAVGLYTIFGGMLSIAVTSYIQYSVISISMIIATVFVFRAVSIESIATAVSQNMGSDGFNPLSNPNLGWTFIFWMLLSNLAVSALWQPVTSRALSAENARTGKRIYNIASFTFAGRAMIPMVWGIAALTMFPGLTGNDALAAMPRMLGAVLPTGIIGILVAGMLAASMSTYSSYLLAPASVITRDVIGASFRDGIPEKTMMTITRIWVAILGIFLVVFGLLYTMPATALKYVYITGNMYTAGAISAVGFGLYWKKANNVGAFIAIITGAVSPLAFLILADLKDALPSSISWMVDANISGFLSFFLGAIGLIAGSLLTQKLCPPKDIDAYFKAVK